jgi:hypothetical protein
LRYKNERKALRDIQTKAPVSRSKKWGVFLQKSALMIVRIHISFVFYIAFLKVKCLILLGDLLAENDSLDRNNYSSHSKVLTKGASVKLLSPHQKNSRSEEESQHQEDESIYYGGGVPGTAISAEEADSCLYSSARSEGYIVRR